MEMLWGVLDYLHRGVRQWLPSPWGLGTWNMRGIILGAREALLGPAEVGFGLLAVACAGGREQDPEDGELEGPSPVLKRDAGWGVGV